MWSEREHNSEIVLRPFAKLKWARAKGWILMWIIRLEAIYYCKVKKAKQCGYDQCSSMNSWT